MATIGIMDSGVGGLSVYKEIISLIPNGRFIYFSDNAWCPYGEKSPELIRERCRYIVDLMISKGAEVIVVACNTATAAAISFLRSKYDLPFIGMEPAVKPAALGTKTGVIGVLATAGTLKGSKYLNTKGRFKDDVKIVEQVGRGFVELVEGGELEGHHAEEVVRASLEPLLDAGADIIVLGCTHYPFLLPVMEKVAGGRAIFIDPAPAVARHLVDVMNENSIAMENGTPGTEFISSAPSELLEKLASGISV